MRTRRRLLQGGTSVLAALGLAGTATSVQSRGSAGMGTSGQASPVSGADEPFDEMYKGRNIQGWPAGTGHHEHGGTENSFRVLIDGTDLHVMKNGDGTWVSLIDHYEVFATPRALARSAVDNLAGADPRPQHSTPLSTLERRACHGREEEPVHSHNTRKACIYRRNTRAESKRPL
ncbi:tyrosinase cofactor [Streptomyces massasporeus]|uniref:apotyrosinase chaperone MelC1 n=1 Tax=Streptomyces massasporeus TaxID=67324 RepID=UPI003687C57F